MLSVRVVSNKLSKRVIIYLIIAWWKASTSQIQDHPNGIAVQRRRRCCFSFDCSVFGGCVASIVLVCGGDERINTTHVEVVDEWTSYLRSRWNNFACVFYGQTRVIFISIELINILPSFSFTAPLKLTYCAGFVLFCRFVVYFIQYSWASAWVWRYSASTYK